MNSQPADNRKGKGDKWMHIRKYIWGICYGIILTAFTGYVFLVDKNKSEEV